MDDNNLLYVSLLILLVFCSVVPHQVAMVRVISTESLLRTEGQ